MVAALTDFDRRLLSALEPGLEPYPRAVLFSKRRFKQRGARYGDRPAAAGGEEAA